jgi:hypothetical protein
MSLEKICVSLETAEKLVEAGIKIESEIFWQWIDEKGTYIPMLKSDIDRLSSVLAIKRYPAPTAEELFDLIPLSIDFEGCIRFISIRRNQTRTNKYEMFDNFGGATFDNPKLSETLAQIVLWLTENI